MLEVILRASYFFGMIALGYGLKKLKVLRKEDAEVLGRVIMNITLPAAILSSFRTYVFDPSMIIALTSCCRRERSISLSR